MVPQMKLQELRGDLEILQTNTNFLNLALFIILQQEYTGTDHQILQNILVIREYGQIDGLRKEPIYVYAATPQMIRYVKVIKPNFYLLIHVLLTSIFQVLVFIQKVIISANLARNNRNHHLASYLADSLLTICLFCVFTYINFSAERGGNDY